MYMQRYLRLKIAYIISCLTICHIFFLIRRVFDFKDFHFIIVCLFQNFDIDVFVDGNGFEVVDNKEDERYPLAFPSNLNSHWLVLSVSDEDKK